MKVKLHQLRNFIFGKANPLHPIEENRRRELLILILIFALTAITIDIVSNLLISDTDSEIPVVNMFLGSLPLIIFYFIARFKYTKLLELIVPIFSNVVIFTFILQTENPERLFIYLFIPIIMTIIFFRVIFGLLVLILNISATFFIDRFVDSTIFDLNVILGQFIPFLIISTLLVIVLSYHKNLIFADNIRIIQESQDQLIQIQKKEIIGKLSGNVAHDFNHLLSVILGHSAILKTQIGEGEGIESINEIQKAIDKAKILISQLLSFTKQIEKRNVYFSLNETLQTFENMFSKIFPSNINFEVLYPKVDISLKGDSNLFGQVILNLVINAQDAITTEGKISIHAYKSDISEANLKNKDSIGGVFIKVIDDGIGIEESILPMIFDSFFTTKKTGTGLGLSISKEIIEQEFGGSIKINSSLSVGTEISIFLPDEWNN